MSGGVAAALSAPIDAERLLTSHEVATLLQCNPSSINKWIKAGRLAAFATPGGHRRIVARDLVLFLQAHGMPISALLPQPAAPAPKVDPRQAALPLEPAKKKPAKRRS